MEFMIPVENCTGCSACLDRCPQNAIEMKENCEGFLVPVVDNAKCSDCGLCLKICPANNVVPVEEIKEPLVYAAWTKDKEVLRQSSSGGMFSELARTVLNKGGVVFGAAYDDNMVVRQIAVETWDDLARLRGSKYVQSDVANSFRLAKDYLDKGRFVLYSGTPCQIAGLYAAIGDDYENLLTCDLICCGVPSPKVFRLYLASLEKRYKSRVTGLAFRDKRNGWLHPTIRLEFENSKIKTILPADSPYSIAFYKVIYNRTSCHQCLFKRGNSVADITIGDFWELLRYQPDLVNYEGASAVIVNTAKGNNVIETSRGRMELIECQCDYLLHDSNLRKSVKAHSDRSSFFADLDHLSFAELTKKYMKPRNVIVSKIAQCRRFCLKWINRIKCC